MKNRFLIVLTAILLIFVLSGCTGDNNRSNGKAPNQSQVQNSGTVSDNRITSAEAEKRAIEHAGFKESDVKHIKSELDFDDGIYEYEVEFYVDTVEYNYKINAQSGEVISFDKDVD